MEAPMPTTPNNPPPIQFPPRQRTIYNLLDEYDDLSPEQQQAINDDPTLAAALEAASYEQEMDRIRWLELYDQTPEPVTE
jgi:hypothetical protein